jgi:mannose-1-phosphate guanylyltransferase
MYYALIMAGGTGTRLWPLSRRRRPKQTLPLVGDRTLFQEVVGRIAPLFPPERILVVTLDEYVETLAAQVPELPSSSFIVEPEGRGTAPAIGLSAIHLRRRDPEAIMAVLTADHFISDGAGFRQALDAAAEVAREERLVTLGIRPTSPSGSYGYIQQGERLESRRGLPVFRADRFVEKPDLTAAVRMVESGQYSWNSGIFVWRAEHILEALQRHMPELRAQLADLEAVLGTPDFQPVLKRVWPQVVKETIDYGVMEKANDIAVIPISVGWSDVGSWTALMELLSADEQGNVVVGPHAGLGTCNSLIFGGQRLVATIGVEDLVIVDTADALLVCTREREQEVRRLVQLLEERQEGRWL